MKKNKSVILEKIMNTIFYILVIGLLLLFFYNSLVKDPEAKRQLNIEKCFNENITYERLDDTRWNCCSTEIIKSSIDGWRQARTCRPFELLKGGYVLQGEINNG